ncbi:MULTISPECIES: glutathione S-transferase family protein [Tenebrionibacter/Tenebrionicola group]|uniref:glutathione transferase n=2 Tax=Tenebrionibacter/Tenebrionicola group TaxID=2969848 RepID=A0A8K0XX02_9ENTR|nr:MULTISPECIES: glutathione S-transferase [Tenebrionibacter/Tenebrionicola group]MBK4714842.1 glutathione S-transferase [Tenebrionibacter intestinalis]MBV5095599.1 glutathione S-transferase [Tenebrionicola larvae]
MLTVHHLDHSRSSRILWMLEELHVPYRIVRYTRQKSLLAPASLKRVHPLGKAPVLEDNGQVMAESGAILEYLQETYDVDGRLRPAAGDERQACRFWLHYAEGSLMPPLLIALALTRLGRAPAPWLLRPVGRALGAGVRRGWLNGQLKTHAMFINNHLSTNPYFAGCDFSIADIQMSYTIAALLARGGHNELAHVRGWWRRIQLRPACQRAIQQGGPFDIPVQA